MKKKIFALLTVGLSILAAVSVGIAQTKDNKNAKTQNNQLITLLPASDGAAAIDAKRLFGEALPQILSANQPLLSEITGKFDEIKKTTGIDLKQFQQIAVGVRTNKSPDGKYMYEPLILARGQYSASQLVTVAKIASNGKYREEKLGTRTIYVFAAKEIIEQNKSKITNSVISEYLDKMLSGLSGELALTTYDDNTLALGSPARMREVFSETKTQIGSDVLGLVARKPNSIISFGAKVPAGLLSNMLDLENDEIGKTVDSIQYLSGSMDVADANTSVSLLAKTSDAKQAAELKDLLDVLVSLAKSSLGGSPKPDKKVYARMAENARIAQNGNEITLDLQVPQSDLNVIVGEKK
jgi:hypothetical protein